MTRQLDARVHAELSVGVREVVLDRLRAQVELGRDLLVGLSLAHELCDLELLRRELPPTVGRPWADRLAGRPQFGARSLCPRRRVHRCERLVRGPEMTPCLAPRARP